jgi:hypothetical protein
MGKYQGTGIYSFEPETDPIKIAAAQIRSAAFTTHINGIACTLKAFGWDSQECRLARMEMAKWQRQERQGQHDQDAHPGNTIIKQQISGAGIETNSYPGISAREKIVGSMDLDHDEGFETQREIGWDHAPAPNSDSDPVLPLQI